MKLKNEDIEIYDSSAGFNTGIAFTLSIYSKNKEELEQLKQEILENQKITKEITELWFDMLEDGIDGLPTKESGAIFEKLSSILPKKIRDARLKEFVENKI